jgi:flagellar assembly factor FliW
MPLLPGEEQWKIVFVDGLLGLPQCRQFVLAPFAPADGSASPFFLLQCQDDTSVSLPLVDPRLLLPDYRVPMAADVLTYLGANTAEELSTLAIVTVRDQVEQITMNLQGPLVINLRSGLGLQLVVEQFPVRYPLYATTEHDSQADAAHP